MSARKVKLTLSNNLSYVKQNIEQEDYKYYDGSMKCYYNYISGSTSDYTNIDLDMSYNEMLNKRSERKYSQVLINYSDTEKEFALSPDQGINYNSTGQGISIYRREYDKYINGQDISNNECEFNNYKEFKGEWHPVAYQLKNSYFRDFNVSNDHLYQYIAYPVNNLEQEDVIQQVFANSDKDNYQLFGDPVMTNWDEWSIVELEPISFDSTNAPIIKKMYKANLDQMWLFKYDLQVNDQTQNIQRQDIQTLDQYSKIGYGPSNYINGQVTALMGSEIVPYHLNGIGYTERLWRSRTNPLSTNERVKMLQQWRKLVASKNPKLLKDVKGQSWIVQIMSSSNTPKNSYALQPDTITFAWRQIESTDDVVIYGIAEDIPTGSCNSNNLYYSVYKDQRKINEYRNDRSHSAHCNNEFGRPCACKKDN